MQFCKILFDKFTTLLHHFDIFRVTHSVGKSIIHFFNVANIGTLFVNVAQRPVQMDTYTIAAIKCCQLWNLGNQLAAQSALITGELYASIRHFSQMSCAIFADSSVNFPLSSSNGVSSMAFTAWAVLTAAATVCFAIGEYFAKFFPSV